MSFTAHDIHEWLDAADVPHRLLHADGTSWSSEGGLVQCRLEGAVIDSRLVGPGTLFVADEIQTGLGRTGRMWAFGHWEVEPDLVLIAKGLSGGFAPVGAILMRRKIFEALFSNMLRAPIHGSTFAKNNLAMAAGLATLDVIEDENLVENAAKVGEGLLSDLRGMVVTTPS